MVGEQHGGRLALHGAGTVEDQTTGGGTDGLGQTQRLALHLLTIQIRMVLVAAGSLLVAELQGLLEGGQRIQTAVRDQRLRLDRTGSHNTSFKSLHITYLPW